jgi:hypothetical protein
MRGMAAVLARAAATLRPATLAATPWPRPCRPNRRQELNRRGGGSGGSAVSARGCPGGNSRLLPPGHPKKRSCGGQGRWGWRGSGVRAGPRRCPGVSPRSCSSAPCDRGAAPRAASTRPPPRPPGTRLWPFRFPVTWLPSLPSVGRRPFTASPVNGHSPGPCQNGHACRRMSLVRRICPNALFFITATKEAVS